MARALACDAILGCIQHPIVFSICPEGSCDRRPDLFVANENCLSLDEKVGAGGEALTIDQSMAGLVAQRSAD